MKLLIIAFSALCFGLANAHLQCIFFAELKMFKNICFNKKSYYICSVNCFECILR
jgi:hypothetical protein